MRGRKATACYWCSKETALETFSCKTEEQKNTKHGGQGLIYKTLFFIFTSIFTIFLAFQQAYIKFTEQLDTSGTLRQFHQEKTGQENKRDIQAADPQSTPDQENITPHQLTEQETQQKQNQDVLPHEIKPAAGQNG